MFKNLFNPDNALMITMSQVTDCLFLSMFWLLGCVPVVTVGVSTAALYDAVYHGLRKGEKNSWQRFFASYRRNLKGGILPGILLVAVILLGGWGMIQCWNAAVYAEVSWKVFSVAMLLGVLVLGVLSVLPPMLSRFENSTAQLLKNTLFLSLANPVGTLLLGALNAGTAAMGVYWPELSFRVTSPQVTVPEYLEDAKRQGISENAAVAVIVGDFQRMDLYAKLGYQLPQHIPEETWQAFHALCAMGFDTQLAK